MLELEEWVMRKASKGSRRQESRILKILAVGRDWHKNYAQSSSR